MPIDHHIRFVGNATVGLDPARDEEAASAQRCMLDGGDHGAFDARQEHSQIILNALPTIIWRSRVNVSGVVTPSPVGVAIVWLKYPGPPTPNDAGDAAFWMNSVVFIARAMRAAVSRFCV